MILKKSHKIFLRIRSYDHDEALLAASQERVQFIHEESETR